MWLVYTRTNDKIINVTSANFENVSGRLLCYLLNVSYKGL